MDDFDLFGGLPTVGGGGDGAADNSVPAKTTEASQTKDTTTTIISTKNTDNQPSNTKPATCTTGDGVVKSEALSDKPKESTSSLVSSIGTSGTKLAFVPQAIRKKKATKQPQKPLEHIPLKKRRFVGILETKIETEAQNTERNNIIKSSLDGQATAGLIASEITWDNNDPHKTNNESQQQATTHEQTTYPENNEPESLRLLHESVTNLYDPHCPNDYLAWRERKKTEQVRKDMQRTALQRLNQQEKMRKKIEEERKKILESGDFNKIVESQASREGAGGVGRGRGRGRGVANNLPAWLVKKQQEQKADSSSASTKPIDRQQFDD